jgi:hypothetical protein
MEFVPTVHAQALQVVGSQRTRELFQLETSRAALEQLIAQQFRHSLDLSSLDLQTDYAGCFLQ